MDDNASILQETLRQLEASIAEKEENIKLGEELTLFKKHPLYKKIIEQGYIESESKRLFDILTDPSGASPDTPEAIHLKLEAISHFKSYVGTEEFPGRIMSAAINAPGMIEEDRLYRTKVTAEYSQLVKEEV